MQPFLSYARAVLFVVRRRPFDTSTQEGRSSERYRRIALTTIANLLARFASVAVSLVTVPLALRFLGKEQYGLWTTITAFVAWAGLFDFGLLNGLVNRITEANGRDDHEGARVYLSSAFVLLAAVAAVLLVATFAAIPLVPWRSVFAVRGGVSDREVGWSVAAALGCVAIAMPLSVVRQVYAGYQRAYVGALFATLGAALTLGGLVVAVNLHTPLSVLVLLFSGAGVLALAANFAFMLWREMPWLGPSPRAVSVPAIKRLLSTSLPMFLFQFGALLVNETQALVLAHRAGLDVVADYSVVWRVYALLVGLISMASASFLPAFREAHERGEGAWSVRSFRRMVALRMGLALVGSAVLTLGGNLVLRLWLRRGDVQFGAHVWIVVAVLCLIAVWTTAFVDLLNIMDRVWPQVAIVVAQGSATVVLTAVLGPRLGVFGALLAIALPPILLSSWLLPRLARGFLVEPGSAPASGAVR